MNTRDMKIILSNVVIEKGMPPEEFYAAWNDEPLTSQALIGAEFMYALPHAVPEHSFVAKTEEGLVIGQCSTNYTVTYWDHVNTVDAATKNQSTQTFVEIQRLAAKVEKEHLDGLKEDIKNSVHNAGIAVTPKYRGNNVGAHMTEIQVVDSFIRKKSTLFCETTNKHCAHIMANQNFTPVAAYPYKELAKETGNAELNKLDDSFSVWCRRL